MTFLEEQALELRKLGLIATVKDDRIIVELTAAQAIFLQATTILSGRRWNDYHPTDEEAAEIARWIAASPDAERRRTLGGLAAGQQLRVDPKLRRTEE